jgi:hypothetical protein
MVISSQNNLRKYRTKGNEQVLYFQDFLSLYIEKEVVKLCIQAPQ